MPGGEQMTTEALCLGIATVILLAFEFIRRRLGAMSVASEKDAEQVDLASCKTHCLVGIAVWTSVLTLMVGITALASRYLANRSVRHQWGVTLESSVDTNMRTIFITCLIIAAVLLCLVSAVPFLIRVIRRQRQPDFLLPLSRLSKVGVGLTALCDVLLLVAQVSGASDAFVHNEREVPVLICESYLAGALFSPFDDTRFMLVVGSPDSLNENTRNIIHNARERRERAFIVRLLTKESESHAFSTSISLEYMVFRRSVPTSIDTLPVSDTDILTLLKHARERVYEVMVGREPSLSLDLNTTNTQAFHFEMMGLLETNKYIEGSLRAAASAFDSAAAEDTTYVAPLLRKADCLVFLADRKLVNADSVDGELNSVHRYLDKAVARDSMIVNHPLYLKVRGDHDYVLAKLHFDEYIRRSAKDPQSDRAKGLLTISEKMLYEGSSSLVMALLRTCEYYKVQYNLSQVYYLMFRTQLALGRPDSAAFYVDLAERAATMSSVQLGKRLGPDIDLWAYRFSRYMWLESDDRALLANAESFLKDATTWTADDLMDSSWIAQARYHMAAIALYRGDRARAMAYLVSADSIKSFDSFEEAIVDPEMKDLWPEIGAKLELKKTPTSPTSQRISNRDGAITLTVAEREEQRPHGSILCYGNVF